MLIVVTGTGTDVGKSWCAAVMLTSLRSQGLPVAARKPVQSFDPHDPHPTDAHVLAAASGEDPERVCPPHRWLRIPLAPPMAAAALGHPTFTIADLAAETRVAPGVITFVEGAGGVRSPLADDGDTATLIAALEPDAVIVVAGADLGTINAVRLTIDALRGHDVLVLLNRFDATNDVHARNRAWLADRDGLEVHTEPEAAAHALVDRHWSARTRKP